MYQMSIFDREEYTISALLRELNATHQAFYYLVSTTEEREYAVSRYKDGDILLAVYYKRATDNGERTIAKAVYLQRTNRDGLYKIAHFDNCCLPHLVDKRDKSLLLNAYATGEEIFDDLRGIK